MRETNKVERFMKKCKIVERLRECEISRIAADLRAAGVIDAGDMLSISTGHPRRDADRLYGILDRDKSIIKFRALAKALHNDKTVENHVQLAATIFEELLEESPILGCNISVADFLQ